MAPPAKRYRIERTHGFALSGSEPSSAGAAPAEDGRIAEILQVVQNLQRSFDPATRVATDVIDAYRKEIARFTRCATSSTA